MLQQQHNPLPRHWNINYVQQQFSHDDKVLCCPLLEHNITWSWSCHMPFPEMFALLHPHQRHFAEIQKKSLSGGSREFHFEDMVNTYVCARRFVVVSVRVHFFSMKSSKNSKIVCVREDIVIWTPSINKYKQQSLPCLLSVVCLCWSSVLRSLATGYSLLSATHKRSGQHRVKPLSYQGG